MVRSPIVTIPVQSWRLKPETQVKIRL